MWISSSETQFDQAGQFEMHPSYCNPQGQWKRKAFCFHFERTGHRVLSSHRAITGVATTLLGYSCTIRNTNVMLQSPKARPSRRNQSGTSGAHGIAPSKLNMIGTTQCARFDEALLSVIQVAQMLNVSRLTIYRLIERGILPVYRIARRLRFHRNDLTAYLAKSRTHNDYGNPQD